MTHLPANATPVSLSPLSALVVGSDTPFLQAVLFQQPLFRGLIQAMQDGVAIVNNQQIILLANQAFLSAFDILDSAHSLPNGSALLPEPAFWVAVARVIAEGTPETLIFKRVHPSSGNQYYSVTLLPLNVSGDPQAARPDACVCLFQNETTIRRTEKMRRDFVANVSHELRTPLSAIHGYAETLLEGALDDQSVARDFVDIIFRHSHRLKQLVADLLDLSKLESPDFTLELIPTNLSTIIHTVVSLAKDRMDQKNIRLSLAIPLDIPLVQAHSSTLEQVITNLTDNAIKYTANGGSIALSMGWSTKYPGMIQVSVADTGMGIPTKYLPRVFERFFRVDKARSRDLGGTGLGLSIVKHIIQTHGGEIWVESEPGIGSTFAFTLKPSPIESALD
ncbi:MAG: ATP-binding protein [Vampirovibrionales bacterium]|nr:ATP-binding protein [Vampirovibrionales bacterium]